MGRERKPEEGLEANEWTCKQTDSQDQSHEGKDEGRGTEKERMGKNNTGSRESKTKNS